MKKILVLIFSLLFASQVIAQDCSNHGVPQNGFPSWEERSLLTMVNICRLDPIGYRDYYLPGAGNILMPDHYPAQPPLQYYLPVNQSARFHSVDMATLNYFQHNDFDGGPWSTRIGRFFPNWSLLGENIAGGFGDPVTTVGGLIADPVNGAPAPDGSGYDGHRWNIMYGNYTVVGCGFAENPASTYRRYWTQDFGRPLDPVPAPCSPIPSGTHLIWFDNTIHYVVNFYDLNNVAPQSANIVFNNMTVIPMNLHLGTAARGTYMYVAPVTGTCHSYHFEITSGNGTHWRYPAHGNFKTFKEGDCVTDYVSSPVDYNSNGVIEVQDIFDFMNAWLASVPNTDFNMDGMRSPQDLFDFINAWFGAF